MALWRRRRRRRRSLVHANPVFFLKVCCARERGLMVDVCLSLDSAVIGEGVAC